MRSMAQGCEKPKPLSNTIKQTWSPSTWLPVDLATTSQGAEGYLSLGEKPSCLHR